MTKKKNYGIEARLKNVCLRAFEDKEKEKTSQLSPWDLYYKTVYGRNLRIFVKS